MDGLLLLLTARSVVLSGDRFARGRWIRAQRILNVTGGYGRAKRLSAANRWIAAVGRVELEILRIDP